MSPCFPGGNCDTGPPRFGGETPREYLKSRCYSLFARSNFSEPETALRSEIRAASAGMER